MMNIKRIVLYIALAIVGVLLFQAWMKDYPPQSANQATAQQTQAKKSTSNDYVPKTFAPKTKSKGQALKGAPFALSQQGQIVHVRTDVLNVKINTVGGNIIRSSLPKYPVSLKKPDVPVTILSRKPKHIYVVHSGITNTTTEGKTTPVHFQAQQLNYMLEPGQHKLVVTLEGKTQNGLNVTKTFTFFRDQYAIRMAYHVKNTSDKPWRGSVYHQIVRSYPMDSNGFYSRSYYGAAISSPKEPYEKLTYKDMVEKNVSRDIAGGWIAMQQKYFLSALVPNKLTTNHYYSHVIGPKNDDEKGKTYVLGFVSPAVTLLPGASKTFGATKLYVGPEVEKRLQAVAKGLDLTIDYGWLWPISKLIFWIMQFINQFIGNWGWSIVVVTILIKIALYWFSDKSYKAMARMRDATPKIQAIRERYKDDKQAMSRETMAFYKKEKINPMGGCLPMLVQAPIFIAWYYVLVEAVQLRQAPFMFWIQDLSVKDPYYILPLLMGATMLLQQWITPKPADPTQAKVMYLMPIIFFVLFMNFPAGLVLYWLTNNVVSVAQQWYVLKTYDPKADAAKRKQRQKNKKKNI